MKRRESVKKHLGIVGLGLFLIWIIPGCKHQGPEIMTTEVASPLEALMEGEASLCHPSLEMKEFNNLFSIEEELSAEIPAGLDAFFAANPPEFPEEGEHYIPKEDREWIEKQYQELSGSDFMSGTRFLPAKLCRFPWKGYLDDSHLNQSLPYLMQLKEPFLAAPMVEDPEGLSSQVQSTNRNAIKKSYSESRENYYGHLAPAGARMSYHFESWNLHRFDPENQWFLYHNRFALQYRKDLGLSQALIYRSIADQNSHQDVGAMEQLYYLHMFYEGDSSVPSKLTIRTIQILPLEGEGEPWRFFANEDQVIFGD